MKQRLSVIVHQLIKKPKRLFLVDGIGALVSALFLGIILPHIPAFENFPENILLSLALMACLFAFYSISVHFLARTHTTFLAIIIFLNSSYALLTATMIVYRHSAIDWPGFLYFTVELIILFILVRIEWKAFQYSKMITHGED